MSLLGGTACLGPRGYLRAHGLGNDYLVVDGQSFGLPIGDERWPERARLLCDRHRGVGSDGVLVAGPAALGLDADIGLRIFNPDGSEAEKSGNGVRIFAAFLFGRAGADRDAEVRIATPGGLVGARFREHRDGVALLTVTLGQVRWAMRALPMLRADGSLPAEDERFVSGTLDVDGEVVRATCLSVGNPHAVLVGARCDDETLRRLGPAVERHARFPQRVNVQLCQPLDRRRIRALVWERGAGPTLASGSSACAVVAACVADGAVDRDVDVEVQMPGGALAVRLGADDQLAQTGPVEEIATGTISDDLWARLSR